MTPTVSVVTTLYHSAPFIREFHGRVQAVLLGAGIPFELIFVNDGSPDDSLAIACDIARQDHAVKVVDLSRNYGHHKAMMTGLSLAEGDLVFLIDVDLEEAPELFLDYWRTLQEDPTLDVVYGIQDQRKGGPVERVTGSLFYRLFNWLSEERIPANMSLSRLMSRRYVQSLLRFHERNLFIPGIWHIIGYGQKGIPITKKSRGGTSYTFQKKLAHLVNAVTSFSDKPLTMIFHTGVVICLGSFTLTFVFLFRKLFYGVAASGWTSLMVAITGLAGVIVLFQGIMGVYLSKMFVELKQRPYTIIRDVHSWRPRERAAAGRTYRLRSRLLAGRGTHA